MFNALVGNVNPELRAVGRFIFDLDLSQQRDHYPFLYHAKILQIFNIFAEHLYDGVKVIKGVLLHTFN
jgi:hypothetical protein